MIREQSSIFQDRNPICRSRGGLHLEPAVVLSFFLSREEAGVLIFRTFINLGLIKIRARRAREIYNYRMLVR